MAELCINLGLNKVKGALGGRTQAQDFSINVVIDLLIHQEFLSYIAAWVNQGPILEMLHPLVALWRLCEVPADPCPYRD